MISDQKERAEHRMLVDLMRNDLTQVAEPGSINVERFDVESYANVQHLVSHITAALKPTLGGSDALGAVFPGGSITGCPRTVVYAVIDELEQWPRSFWTGSIGYIDVHGGQSAWNILIRTLEAHLVGGRWQATVGAGGGITIASEAKKEVEEAAWKGAALRIAAGWMRKEHTALPSGTLGIHPLQPQVNQQVVLDAAEFWNGNNEVMRCQPAASCSLTTSIRFPSTSLTLWPKPAEMSSSSRGEHRKMSVGWTPWRCTICSIVWSRVTSSSVLVPVAPVMRP